MLCVIFWEVLGLFVLGITLYLLAVAKPGTVAYCPHQGRQHLVSARGTVRRHLPLYCHRQAGRGDVCKNDPAEGYLCTDTQVEAAAVGSGNSPAVSDCGRLRLYPKISIN